jgi:hypothetical protein
VDLAFRWKSTLCLFGVHSKIQQKYFMGLRSAGNQNLLEVNIAPVWQPFFPSQICWNSFYTSGGQDFFSLENFPYQSRIMIYGEMLL